MTPEEIILKDNGGTLSPKIAAPPLKWTREKPSAHGMYWVMWARRFQGSMVGPQLVEVDGSDYVLTIGNDVPEPITDVAWWYGPLPIEQPAPPSAEGPT